MKFRNLTGTHGGRIVLAAVPVAVVATVLMGGVANGAVPVTFAVVLVLGAMSVLLIYADIVKPIALQ